jgi:hypothetical protein
VVSSPDNIINEIVSVSNYTGRIPAHFAELQKTKKNTKAEVNAEVQFEIGSHNIVFELIK